MNIPYLRYGLWSALILFFTWATLGSVCAQARYTITDLGTPDGSYAPNAAGINNRGQVIGGSYKHIVDYGDVDVPWLWDSVKGLQAFPFYGRPFGINDAGTITGWTRNSAGAYSGFLYNGTSQQTIPLLAGATDTLPRSIDADGTVVGYAAGAAGTTAFTFDQVHGTTPIGSLVPGGESQATGIRNGKIAGWAASSQLDLGGHPAFHAFLYDGTMHDLGTFGGLMSVAYGINASGQVVGGADTATNDFSGQVVSHAFVYSMGKMHDLGTTDPMFAPSSYGTSINAVGQVVGVAYSPSGFGGNAFLWTPEVSNSTQGKMELLQDLLPADAGWRLYSAWGINDVGQIVGTGFHNGAQAAFLMTPANLINSSSLKLSSSYPGGTPQDNIDGIVCDNLRGMVPDLLDKIDITVDASAYPNADFSGSIVTGINPGCVDTTHKGHLYYYPPDEFNENPEPDSVADVTKPATRQVTLSARFTSGGKQFVVASKPTHPGAAPTPASAWN